MIPDRLVLVGLAIFIAVLTAVAGISYHISHDELPMNPLVDTSIDRSLVQRSDSPERLTQTDWQTYRNGQHSFEFRYPSSWRLKELGSDAITLDSSRDTSDKYNNEQYLIEVLEGTSQTFSSQRISGEIAYDPMTGEWFLLDSSRIKLNSLLPMTYTDTGLPVYLILTGEAGSLPVYVVPLSSTLILSLSPAGDYPPGEFQTILSTVSRRM